MTEKIGQGGMGAVWKALDTSLDREITIKVLPADVANDPDRLERFRREATSIAAFNHPNIVTIYSVEEADGVYLLTMELVEGRTLDRHIPVDGLARPRLFDLAIPLADAGRSRSRNGSLDVAGAGEGPSDAGIGPADLQRVAIGREAEGASGVASDAGQPSVARGSSGDSPHSSARAGTATSGTVTSGTARPVRNRWS